MSESAMRRVLLLVDAGKFHFRERRSLASKDRKVADELAALGFLRVAPRDARFPKRLVLTADGSHAIGTFDMCSDDFRREVWLARRAARKAA